MSFIWRFLLALAAGLAAAVILAPIAAIGVAKAGLHYPFPRIFDRVVMLTVFGAIAIAASNLGLIPLLRRGFANPARNARRALRGLAVAVAALAILYLAAFGLGANPSAAQVGAKLPGFILSGIVIAIIEEGFFRAFLLGGMKRDFGAAGALVVSSAIYSIAHIVRAPARFYVAGFDPLAGLRTLALSLGQLAHPGAAAPALLGLFLLGLVLGEAYVLTGTVYFSIGLHAGLVIGQKLWPRIFASHAAVPHWLAGFGSLPLISGAAAWMISIAILVMLRRLAGARRAQV